MKEKPAPDIDSLQMAEVTIQDTFALAIQHHQAGRLQEAEQLYRQVLARQPNHVDAIHNLGVMAQQVGQYAIAVDLIRRVIGLHPNFPEAYLNLGNALKLAGRHDEAVEAYRQAVAIRPGYAQAHSNLGNILKEKGKLEEAIEAYRMAVAAAPGLAEPYSNLGDALRQNGNFDEAIEACGRAIALRPTYPEAHCNLSAALKEKGLFNEAIAAARQAIALNPNLAEAHYNLGNAMKQRGLLDEAFDAYRQAIALKPKYAEAQINLGTVLRDKGQFDEAIAAYRQAIAVLPDSARAQSNLGNALKDKGQLDEAIAAYHRAIALEPNLPQAYSNLGNALKDGGRLDEAIASYRRAIALDPNMREAHSSLVFSLQLHPDYDALAIAGEHERWNRQFAEPLRKFIPPHSNDSSPDRRLRVGYVSPDFRNHVVGQNVLQLFRGHDREAFEITAYAQVVCPDAITGLFQQHADRWRNIVGLTDEQVATQIRDDKIDILVDLALHTEGNRLLVFARRPAPVQVTFAGYPGTTGLSAIDYRLSDSFLDPPNMDESVYSEKTIRLPDSFWCYNPLDGGDIAVNSLPALETGAVTFGCLSHFGKINDFALALWAKVLGQVKNSRLILMAKQGGHQQATLERFGREGIDPSRVEFVPRQSRRDYLKEYHRIDLCLDSFPYNGHTTSLDSLWMGVPVVTLVGQTAVSRAGWCQLSNLGLTELAGRTPEQFVHIAVELAKNLPRLKELRSTLRSRMEQSPLMDSPRFIRNIETAYRLIWRKWCETVASKE